MDCNCAFSTHQNECTFPTSFFKEDSKVFYVCSNHLNLIDTARVEVRKFKILKVSDFRDQHMKKIQEKIRNTELSKIAYIAYSKLMIEKINKFCRDRIARLDNVEKFTLSYRNFLQIQEFIEDFKLPSLSSIIKLNSIVPNHESIRKEFENYLKSYPKNIFFGNDTKLKVQSLKIENKRENKNLVIDEPLKINFYEYFDPEIFLWDCKCGSSNMDDWHVCPNCGDLKPGLLGWACKDCTSKNEKDSQICKFCYRSKDKSLLKPPEKWKCSNCDSYNNENNFKCYHCNAERSKILKFRNRSHINLSTKNANSFRG